MTLFGLMKSSIKLSPNIMLAKKKLKKYSTTSQNIEKAKKENIKAKICIMLMAEPTVVAFCLWCSFIN